MAIVRGKLARVLIGSTPAVVGHLVGKIDYEVSDTLIETTAYDSTTRTYVPADLKTATLSIEAQFDAADAPQDALRTAMVAGAVALVPVTIYPEGSTAGLVKFSGSMALKSLKVLSADVEGITTMAATFEGAPLVEATV
jgi:hypothetical protein